MKKIINVLMVCIMSISFLCGCSGGVEDGVYVESTGNDYKATVQTVTAKKADLRDKILGGWVGHILGYGSGFEYVWDGPEPMVGIDDRYWEPNGTIAAGTLGTNYYQLGPYDPSYKRVSKGRAVSDDDIHIDLFNQWIFEKLGPNVSYADITKMWKDYDLGDAAGGDKALEVIKSSNYIAPYVGIYAYGNTLYCATEPWIENETLGMLFPYMPTTAAAYAEMFTTISGDCYGLYLGRLCSLMYSYAMTETDSRVALAKAFEHMEKSNDIYTAYQYVLDCYEKNPEDWRACAHGLVAQHQGHRLMNVNSQIALDVCAGFIFTGIIFGENDFEQSLKITSLAGYDGDCTAATVGGLMGIIKGYNAMPEKYRAFLGEDSVYINDRTWFAHIGGDYPDEETLKTIVDRTVKNMEAQIVANGGSVGEAEYTIKAQTYRKPTEVVVNNYGFRDKNTDNWLAEGCELSLTKTAHTGEVGGEILITGTDGAKAYQNLSLVKGDIYHVILYVAVEAGTEIRIFAEDGNHYFSHSYSTPINSLERHLKAELTFTASAEEMKIGIHIPKQSQSSAILYIDDLFVENVSDSVARECYRIQAENCEVAGNAKAVNAANAVGGKAVTFSQGDKIRFKVQGDSDCFSNVRVYYKNNSHWQSVVKVYIDGTYQFNLPLLAQGETADFGSGNWADFGVSLGDGEHTIMLEMYSDSDIYLDCFEIRKGNLKLRNQ